MPEMNEVLALDCTRAAAPGSSRKRVLEFASELLASHLGTEDAGGLFDQLMARERLGSTAVGEGIALPHCRMAGCTDPVAGLLHLEEAVDFEAPDGRPVDLVFVLVVPEDADETHLEILAMAAGAFNDPGYRDALRDCADDQGLFESALATPSSPRTAAGH